MRVLYIEDDTVMAKSVTQMLQSDGHVCDMAGYGTQAVELAKRTNYDFILVDVMLPDIDGFEVIKKLKDSDVHTPFLIQSGLVDRHSTFGGLAFGVGEYLVKPFTKTELVDKMHTVLARSRINEVEAPRRPANGADQAERREHRRFKTVRPAVIRHNSGIECKITDMSHGGAAIKLPEESCFCPPSFELKTRTGTVYQCEVCWRMRDRIGVKFV